MKPLCLALFCCGLCLSTAMAQNAAWGNHKRGRAWSAETLRLVDSVKLFNVIPTDIDSFCPDYRDADKRSRSLFWLILISAMSKKESTFDTGALYIEPFRNAGGEKVVGRGLLQVAIDDTNRATYACRILDTADLYHPEVNLRCGIRILNRLVRKDLRIGSYPGEEKHILGGARYWSVLRARNPAMRWIRKTTLKAACCKH